MIVRWFNPTVPTPTQGDRWGCAAVALQWALESLGVSTTRLYLTGGLIKDGYLIPDDGRGVVDKLGVDLAEYTNRTFGFMGIVATVYPNVEWPTLCHEAGRSPLVLYGEGWQHWTAVRGLSLPGGPVILANGADPLRRVPRQLLTEVDFRELGPFHMVAVRRN
jgi:hypothetical protein